MTTHCTSQSDAASPLSLQLPQCVVAVVTVCCGRPLLRELAERGDEDGEVGDDSGEREGGGSEQE